MNIAIRHVQHNDREQIHSLLEESEMFRRDEIEVAMELIDIVLAQPLQRDYEVYVASDEQGIVVGYYCIGPRPVTKGTFDLYWIAVKKNIQAQGIGTMLMRHAEDYIMMHHGRLLIIETSSQPQYEATNRFYQRCWYEQLARIRNFYDVDDDMIVYGKYFSQ
jgi:ribosomal protein S18 acetylase RimI-like enzyme